MMMLIVVTLQMILDDVGVTIAMITITLLAVVVVKVLLFSDKVQPPLTLSVTTNPPIIAAGPECVHVLAAGAAGEVQHPVHGQGVHPV